MNGASAFCSLPPSLRPMETDMENHILHTSLGPMTASQVVEEMDYRFYRNQRELYNIQPERMYLICGQVDAERFEERYRKEKRG